MPDQRHPELTPTGAMRLLRARHPDRAAALKPGPFTAADHHERAAFTCYPRQPGDDALVAVFHPAGPAWVLGGALTTIAPDTLHHRAACGEFDHLLDDGRILPYRLVPPTHPEATHNGRRITRELDLARYASRYWLDGNTACFHDHGWDSGLLITVEMARPHEWRVLRGGLVYHLPTGHWRMDDHARHADGTARGEYHTTRDHALGLAQMLLARVLHPTDQPHTAPGGTGAVQAAPPA